MDKQSILHTSAQVIFVGASAAIVLAFLELGVQFFGTSLIGSLYPPGRIIELAAALLVLVIAIVLREIRDVLRAGRP
ncbi:MAG: hypothetical protein IH838_04555 [Proteobacteria bacterium]|nr:hypothetical protein [Pseudomonadota bacterium]